MICRMALAFIVCALSGNFAFANTGKMTDALVYVSPPPACGEIPFDEWAKFADCRLKYTIQLQDVLKKREDSNRLAAEALIKKPWAWLTGRPSQGCSSLPPEELKKFFCQPTGTITQTDLTQILVSLQEKRGNLADQIQQLEATRETLNARAANLPDESVMSEMEGLTDLLRSLDAESERARLLTLLSSELGRGQVGLPRFRELRFGVLTTDTEILAAPDDRALVSGRGLKEDSVIVIATDQPLPYQLILHSRFGLGYVLNNELNTSNGSR